MTCHVTSDYTHTRMLPPSTKPIAKLIIEFLCDFGKIVVVVIVLVLDVIIFVVFVLIFSQLEEKS